MLLPNSHFSSNFIHRFLKDCSRVGSLNKNQVEKWLAGQEQNHLLRRDPPVLGNCLPSVCRLEQEVSHAKEEDSPGNAGARWGAHGRRKRCAVTAEAEQARGFDLMALCKERLGAK